MIDRLVGAITPGQEAGPEEVDGSDPGDRAEGEAEAESGAVAGNAVDGDELYLAPDERILVLLSEHDGRLFQQEIVERTDYSAARISELLCEMERDDRINRYWDDGSKVVAFPELGPE